METDVWLKILKSQNSIF